MNLTNLQKKLLRILITLTIITSCVLVYKLLKVDQPSQTPVTEVPEIQEQTMSYEMQYQSEPIIEVEEPITEWYVEEGDNLWSIADSVYGDGCYYPYIIKVNGMEGDIIRIGQNIHIEYFEEELAEEILDECYDYIIAANRAKKAITTFSNSNGSARNGRIPDNLADAKFLGNFKITGYDPYCAHCCGGKSNGHTSGGTIATVGRTIAAPKNISIGSILYIEGYGIYKVEDRGGFNSNVIDIAANSHDECYSLTTASAAVYIVK